MKTFNELFESIKQSNITLIGYTFKDERIKDELISNFNCIEIEKVDSSFSFKSFLRDLKIDSLFIEKTENLDYILININNIKCDSDDIVSRQRQIGNILRKINNEIYSDLSNYLKKIIITCPLYKSGVNSEGGDINNFIGGEVPLYMSDLAMIVYSDRIRVFKNRNGNYGDYILNNTKQSVEI